MKYILNLLVVMFVFTGCFYNDQVVEIKMPSGTNSTNIGKKVNTHTNKGDTTTVITSVEDDTIVESNVPTLESSSSQIKVALIYPSKYVASYVKSSVSTIMAYLDYIQADYDLEVIDTSNEDISNVQAVLNSLKSKGIDNVIALLTPNFKSSLSSLDVEDMKIYLPLMNIDENVYTNENFIYGSISYDKQIKTLLEEASSPKYAMFYQNSFLGKKLERKFAQFGDDIFTTKKEIQSKRNNFRSLVRDSRLKNATIFLNTDIVKSSLLLSQMRVYNTNPNKVMATQINYNPKLISLTQRQDRKKFIVANSIGEVDAKLLDEIDIFGGDVKYNWVDYSVLVGIDYLYDRNSSGLIDDKVEDGRAVYNPKLYQATDYGFSEIK